MTSKLGDMTYVVGRIEFGPPDISGINLATIRPSRLRRILSGLCPQCGKRPALPGYRYCQPCHTKHIEACDRYIERHAGLCSGCHTRKRVKGYTHCSRCRKRRKKDYYRRTERGLCLVCRYPLDETAKLRGAKICSSCQDRRNVILREWRARK